MERHGPLFKRYVDSNKLNKTHLAKKLGMSPQNLYQLFKSKEFQAETVKSIETVLKTSWEEIAKASTNNIAINMTTKIKKSSPDQDEDLKNKYIALLEENNRLLREKEYLQQEVLRRLNDISETQLTNAAAQQAWQEFWTEHIPLKEKMTLVQIKGIIRNKAFDKQELFQKEGIQIS